MREYRAKGTDNTFAMPLKVAKGLGAARYAFCFFDLAPDEALWIESDVPDARYWGLQLATNGLVRAGRPGTSDLVAQPAAGPPSTRTAASGWPSRSATRAVRIGSTRVATATACSRSAGSGPQSDPTPTTRVVGVDEVASLLPDDSPRIDAAARAADVRARKEHLAWRFRT